LNAVLPAEIRGGSDKAHFYKKRRQPQHISGMFPTKAE
jgi:hypothetical protein